MAIGSRNCLYNVGNLSKTSRNAFSTSENASRRFKNDSETFGDDKTCFRNRNKSPDRRTSSNYRPRNDRESDRKYKKLDKEKILRIATKNATRLANVSIF